MTNLILSSNFSGNKLFGVGEATLQNQIITINIEPGTEVTLFRGTNKVTLSKIANQKAVVSGRVELNDVYAIENSGKKLTIKIEQSDTYHETSLYVDNEKIIDATSAKRRSTLSVGIIILLLLVVSVFFGLKQKQQNEFNTKSEIKLTTAIENFNLKTRESFLKAQEIAFELKNSGYKNEKLDELIKKINENESDILGEVKADPKELLDLTLQINGFEGSKMASTSEDIFVLDEREKNIIQLDFKGKNAKIVANKDDLDGLISIASYQDRLFSLNKDGIYEIDNSRNKVKDLDWGESLFYLYSANIYMLDKGNNQIYRFSGSGKTFGNKSEWLAPGVDVDFSKVIDMVIDGSIWALSSSGKVTKFTNGNPIAVTMDGIVNPLNNPTAIYTNENLKNTYVLDKSKGRVVVIEKNGKFKIQYASDKFKEASDFVVNQDETRLVVSTGSKLLYIDIKN